MQIVVIIVYALISIHALLAESDKLDINRTAKTIVFLSTLSLRRATGRIPVNIMLHFDFYPRSPCGERLQAGHQ